MRLCFAHPWKSWAPLLVFGGLSISNAQDLLELDTDGDGLSDHIELTITLTDPNRADTDGDGVSDLEEVENENLDPNDASITIPRRLLYLDFEIPQPLGPGAPPHLGEDLPTLTEGWIHQGWQSLRSQQSQLHLPWLGNDGLPLITMQQGTIRFWYRPEWSSKNIGGAGPENFGRFLELGGSSSNTSLGWWTFYLNPNSDKIQFLSKDTSTQSLSMNAPVSLEKGQWYQIVLTYHANQTFLYINGEPIAEGPGIRASPSLDALQASGLWIGSSIEPSNQVNGTMDELETFNYPMPSARVHDDYVMTQKDSDRDGLSDYQEMLVHQTDPDEPDTDRDGVNDGLEIRKGSSPLDPQSFPPLRLAYFPFDDGRLVTEAGNRPKLNKQVRWIRSWDGSAAEFQGEERSELVYAHLEQDLSRNIHLAAGSIRFWISPQWGENQGTPSIHRLLEVGRWSPDGSLGWWVIQFSAQGDQLQFISQGDHQSVYHLNQPIAWQNNQWYQVTITYDSFTSQLYINGEATASGPGITVYPRDDLATLTGIRIGSGLAGSFSLDAIIDNLETFNYPLDETEIQENYLAVSPDHDGDGIISFEEEFLHLDPLNPDTDYDGVSDGQELEEGTKPLLSFDGLPRRLASFPFEDGTLTGNRRQLPRLIGEPKQPIGWKGYGFHFSENRVEAFSYLDTEKDGLANINLRRGTIECWFKPDWQSGEGPVEEAPLVAMGFQSSLTPSSWWSLHFHQGGSRIRLQFEDSGRAFTSFDVPLNWEADTWHHLALAYDVQGTKLWIDGQTAATGRGILAYPNLDARRESGIMIGTYPEINATIEGVIDELAFYNYKWTEAELIGSYDPQPPDSDQDGLSDQDEMLVWQTNYLDPDTDFDGMPDGAEIANGTNPLDATVFNPSQLSRISFDDETLQTDQGKTPYLSRDIELRPSFSARNGYFAKDQSLLIYRVREEDGSLNINLREGSIKFWIKPNWSSGTKGHPFGSRLIEVGEINTRDSSGKGWWSLFLNQDRTSMTLGSQGPNTTRWVKHLQADRLEFEKDQWYEIELSYAPRTTYAYNVVSPNNVQEFLNCHLYIDGRRVASGPGIAPTDLPAREAQLGGFAIGSTLKGSLACEALMDDFQANNFARNIWSNYTLHDNAWAAKFRLDRNMVFLMRRPEMGPDGMHPVEIERRFLGETQWTTLASEFTGDRFVDKDVAAGLIYEYQFRSSLKDTLEIYQNRITVAAQLPPIHNRGNLILIREEGIIDLLGDDYLQFKRDLEGDGWSISDIQAARHAEDDWDANRWEIDRIKKRIQSIVKRFPDGYPHVILNLGHVPIPRSGLSAFDGHFFPTGGTGYHRGAWACDSYYGSLDEDYWKDDALYFHKAYSALQNVPHDGKWDADTLPRSMEIPVGRIDFWGLDSFFQADFTQIEDQDPKSLESFLLRQYLQKNHRYRHGLLEAKEQFTYLNGLSFMPQRSGIFRALNLSASFFGIEEGKAVAGRPLYSKVPIQFGYHEMRAFPAGIQLGWKYNQSTLTYSHTTFDLLKLENEPKVLFHLMFGSWFGDWNLTRENWLRALLATPNYGLISLYFPKFWDLEKMGLGAPFAVAMLEMGDLTDTYRDAPRMLSIMGDPTLRLNTLKPVSGLSISRSELENRLSWNPHSDLDLRFYVYRKDDSGEWNVLNPSSISQTSYTDLTSSPQSDYMVKTTKLQVTGSGSYHNLSQGIAIQISE